MPSVFPGQAQAYRVEYREPSGKRGAEYGFATWAAARAFAQDLREADYRYVRVERDNG